MGGSLSGPLTYWVSREHLQQRRGKCFLGHGSCGRLVHGHCVLCDCRCRLSPSHPPDLDTGHSRPRKRPSTHHRFICETGWSGTIERRRQNTRTHQMDHSCRHQSCRGVVVLDVPGFDPAVHSHCRHVFPKPVVKRFRFPGECRLRLQRPGVASRLRCAALRMVQQPFPPLQPRLRPK